MKKNAGFSVIELILVVALLGVVLSLAFSLNLFGIKTFHLGATQSDLQNELKLSEDLISRELRYATKFDLTDAVPADLGDFDAYFYVDNGVLYHNTRALTDAVITSYSFSRNKSVITIIIDGEKTFRNKTQYFQLNTNVHLNNYSNISFPALTDSGAVILYKR